VNDMPEQTTLAATMEMNTKGFQAALTAVLGITKAVADYNQQVQKLTEVRRAGGRGEAVGVVGAGGVGVRADITGGAGKRTAEFHKGMTAALEAMNESLFKNAALIARTAKEWDKETKSVRKASAATRKVTNDTDKSAWALNRAQFQLRQFGRTLYFAGRDLIMFGAILTGIMGYAIKTFAEVEEQISRVEIRLQIMGKSAAEAHQLARELADEAIRIGKEWGYGAREATKALASLSSAGIKATQSIHILKQATILARINFISMDQATEVLVQYLKATGRTAKDAEVAIKELTVAQNNSFESLTSLAAGFGFAMTSLMEYGAASEDVAVAMTVFTKTGTSSTVAGRRLSSMYGHLTENGRKYGIQVKDAAGKTLEMKDMMLAVRERAEFFGDEMIRQQFLLEVLGITGKDAYEKMIKAIEAGEWDKMLAEFEDTEIAAGKLAEVVRDDLKIAFEKFTAAMEAFLTTVGQWLAPWIIAAADVIGDLADAMEDLEDVSGPVGGAILGVGIAATAAGIALAGLGMVISTGVGGWALAKGAIVKFGGALTNVGTYISEHILLMRSGGVSAGGLGRSFLGLVKATAVLTIYIYAAIAAFGIIVGFLEIITGSTDGLSGALKGLAGAFSPILRVLATSANFMYQCGRSLGILIGLTVKFLAIIIGGLIPKPVMDGLIEFWELLDGLATGFEDVTKDLERCNDYLVELNNTIDLTTVWTENLNETFEAFADMITGSVIVCLDGLAVGIDFVAVVLLALMEPILRVTGVWKLFEDAIRWIIKLIFMGESPGLIEVFNLTAAAINSIKEGVEFIISPLETFGGALTALLGGGPLELVKGTLEAIKDALVWLQENTKFKIEIDVDLVGGGADFLGGLVEGGGDLVDEGLSIIGL